MKKTVICGIPMREIKKGIVHESNDKSLPVSNMPYVYVVNSFLSETLNAGDSVTAILLAKEDENDFYKNNIEFFKQEMDAIAAKNGADVEYVHINTSFNQERETHNALMGALVDSIEEKSHIIADTTFGPKDLPVVLFTALGFAEKFLNCEIENIIYGQGSFANNELIKSQICDMTPLYYLSSITNTLHCNEPEKARQMLKTLLAV